MTIFDKQDSRLAKSLELFSSGSLNQIYAPYFNWKSGSFDISSLSETEGRNIMHTASDELEAFNDKHPQAYTHLDSYIDNNPWQNFKGFNEDKFIVCALQGVEDEMSMLVAGGMLQG